jgi:hypothetical protein
MDIEENQMEAKHPGFLTLTEFGEVRWRLNNSRAPGVGILVATSRDVLLEAAHLLCEVSTRSLAARRRRLQFLFERGLLKLATELGDEEQPGTVNLESIANESPCQVLYLPQIYLVYLPEPDQFPTRHDHLALSK